MPLDVIDLTAKLVKFDTTSAKSNSELAAFISEILSGMGFDITLQKKEERGGVEKANLVARIGPKDVEPLMLSGHMDAMPIGNVSAWKKIKGKSPLVLTELDGKLYGRGSVDMKGPLAAMICAVEPLVTKAASFRRELIFGLTHDEEVGLKGARRMVDEQVVKPRFTLIAEPTELIPMRMHKGHLCLTAVCYGEKAHAACPEKGRNAIELGMKVIAVLQKFREELKGVREPCINPPYSTLNIGIIQGGTVLNEVPDRCEVSFAIRMIPGQSTDRIRSDIVERLSSIGWDKKNGGKPLVEVITFGDVAKGEAEEEKDKKKRKPKEATEPMCTPATSELVMIAEKVSKHSARGACYSTDAPVLQELGTDCVIFGPGNIYVAHKPDEYIEIKQLNASVIQFREIVAEMCLPRSKP